MSSPARNTPSPSPHSAPVSKDHSPSLEKEEAEDAEEEAVDAAQADFPSHAETTTRPDSEPVPSSTSAAAASSGSWQAIWSPAHNAYYFFNAHTHETTWVNPLQPSTATTPSAASQATPDPSAALSTSTITSTNPSTSTSSAAPVPSAADANAQEEGSSSGSSSGATPVPASVAQIYALQEAAAAQGIDPSLAHLDPSLAGPSAPGSAYNFSARFNAHTGTFTRPDGRDPTHLSEYERMKRMSSVYFNMEEWEQEVAQRKISEDEDAANGKKRKRPTKKDLDRFKEQKRLKKIAKTAWLRT
ncbi:hypothetical protein BC826DRAFT_1101932 [Russula brevipes]|nr:hypothetical protein BC826DRAFT_1101932 [Russula brevipes]